MKRLILLPAICMALSVSAAESAPVKPADFIRGEQLLTEKDGVLAISKSSDLYCKQRMPINPAKRYRLSGEFRQTGGNGIGTDIPDRRDTPCQGNRCFLSGTPPGQLYHDRSGYRYCDGNLPAE